MERNGVMFFDQIISGLNVGSVYALVGLGFALIYGVLGLINFAHGEVCMIGAFLSFSVMTLLGFGFYPSLIASVVLTGILGILIDRIGFKPIRKASHIAQLISTLAIAIVLRNLAMIIWGSRTFPFPNVLGDSLRIVIPVTLVVMVVLLHFIINRTKMGIAIRAISMKPETAATLGVNTNRLTALVVSIGSALGGLAGILIAMYYASITFDMGITLGLKAFVASIIGGLGNIYGTILGGLILGISEGLVQAYISTSWVNVISYSIMILVLLFRPSGLFGKSVEKGG
jgi:branched-chain amino acid transport system permease protein